MKTVREGKLGKLILRAVEKDGRYIGIVLGAANPTERIEGDTLDDVWRRLHDEAGKGDANYFGFDGARARFRTHFPDGFHSPGYDAHERTYKLAAKAKLDATAPLGTAASGSGLGEAVLRVFQATNLLSPFEKTRLQGVLRGDGADPFIRAAAKFALGGGGAALADMEAVLKPHEANKWTVVTYLPFLWRPDAHMFLKPEVTKDFAARVGHPFASQYEAPLRMSVYDSLLDLVAKTEAELALLKPRDRIDVQSFIWVVGAY